MGERTLGGIVSVKAAINKYGQKATRSVSGHLDLPVIKVNPKIRTFRLKLCSFFHICAKNAFSLLKF